MKVVKLSVTQAAKLVSEWGESGARQLEFLALRLRGIGFVGPLSFASISSIPYASDISDDLRVCIGVVRRIGDHEKFPFFDISVVLQSRLLYGLSKNDDIWMVGCDTKESWLKGYVSCLSMRLSNLKWAEIYLEKNPAWELSESGIEEALLDLERLVLKRIRLVKSAHDLREYLLEAVKYRRPEWVKSSAPGIVGLKELISLLD